jgi:hypothetical protein
MPFLDRPSPLQEEYGAVVESKEERRKNPGGTTADDNDLFTGRKRKGKSNGFRFCRDIAYLYPRREICRG